MLGLGGHVTSTRHREVSVHPSDSHGTPSRSHTVTVTPARRHRPGPTSGPEAGGSSAYGKLDKLLPVMALGARALADSEVESLGGPAAGL